MEERTEWRGQSESQIGEEKSREVADLLVLPNQQVESAKSLQNGAGFSRKT